MDQQTRQQLLNTMGIDVWYLRGVSNRAAVADVALGDMGDVDRLAPDVSPATTRMQPSISEKLKSALAPVEQAATREAISDAESSDLPMALPDEPDAPPAQPLRFRWLVGGSAVYLYDASDDPLIHGFVREVIRYIEWRLAAQAHGDAQAKAGALSHGEFKWPQLMPATGNPSGSLRAFFDKHHSAGVSHVICDQSVAQRLQTWSAESLVMLPDVADACIDSAIKRELWACLRQSL